ncbi:MAG: hypothetical protein ACLRZ7_00840 [Lachnospiraceae bacterium]
MVEKKNAEIGNFNIVFWDREGKEEPLLDYFDTIVMPALNSGFIRKTNDTEYFFNDIRIIEFNNEYVVVGNFIKKTVLEKKSDLDENGELIGCNEKYPTAPFSIFVIYLKNHRMLLVKNQKGSPTLKNFGTTFDSIINRYIKHINQNRKKEKLPLYPNAAVNVVGIPQAESISEVLNDVERITELRLRFYPLNGDADIDFSGIFGDISNELRSFTGSRGGEIKLNSPKDKKGVEKIIEKAKGIVEPILRVKYPGKKNAVTIKNEEISERLEMDFPGTLVDISLEEVVQQGLTIDSIREVSGDNLKIYERNKYKILKMIKK